VLVLFQEGHVGVVLDLFLVGELAQVLADRGRRLGGLVLVVGHERRLVDHLVQLGRDDVLFLVFLVGLGGFLDLVLALVGLLRLGRDRAGAHAAVLHRLVGVELG